MLATGYATISVWARSSFLSLYSQHEELQRKKNKITYQEIGAFHFKEVEKQLGAFNFKEVLLQA